MSPVKFPAPQFDGHATVLAEQLRQFKIRLREYDSYTPCVDYIARDGCPVREVGEVLAHRDGRITCLARSYSSNRGRVILLRAAERVLTHGAGERGWREQRTPSGTPYRKTTILAYLDGGPPDLAAAVATDVDEYCDQALDGLAQQLLGEPESQPGS